LPKRLVSHCPACGWSFSFQSTAEFTADPLVMRVCFTRYQRQESFRRPCDALTGTMFVFACFKTGLPLKGGA
jgi:hypothetical protein